MKLIRNNEPRKKTVNISSLYTETFFDAIVTKETETVILKMSDANFTVLAGAGLLRSNNALSVNPTLRLKNLTVREKITIPEPTSDSDAATKSYVDKVYTDTSVRAGTGLKMDDDLIISIRNNQSLKNVKLSGQVSLPEHATTKDYVDNLITPLPTKNYVDTSVIGLIKESKVNELVEPLASRHYVYSFMEIMATKKELKDLLVDKATHQEIQDSVIDLAKMSWVYDVIEEYAKTSDLTEAVSLINAYISSTVEKSKEELQTVKESIIEAQDELVQLVKEKSRLAIQYVQPVGDDEISFDVEKDVLLLDGKEAIDSLKVNLPETALDGQVVKISTTRDVDNLELGNGLLLGDLLQGKYILTAGSSLTIVYSTDAHGWFSL